MIQFNLLPDVKKQYIKTKRTKRLITTASFVAASASLVVVALVYSYVQFGQKSNIDDLTKDIAKEVSALQSIEDLDKILTVQNQLEELPGLHENKPSTSRLFEYLSVITPSTVTINSLTLSVESMTLSISGSADSLASINQYADTLKFATYSTADINDGKPFSDVITRLNRDDEGANYTIDLTYDPVLFDNRIDVSIVVPNTITTRSSLGQPATGEGSDLFQEAPQTDSDAEPGQPTDETTGGPS